MQKLDVNGNIIVPVLLVAYAGAAITILQILEDPLSLAGEIDASFLKAQRRFDMISVALIGGAGIFASILWVLEKRFTRPAPQWNYIVWPLLAMASIYVFGLTDTEL